MRKLVANQDDAFVTSTVVIAQPELWSGLVEELRKSVQAGDFWQSADLEKNLSVAEVQHLHYFANQTPFGKVKIAVICLADQLRNEVANALLKLLEEPPTYLRLILFSQSDNLLPTIRSRVDLVFPTADFATIIPEKNRGERASWQIFLEKFDRNAASERQELQNFLYLQSLMHSGIKTDPILESFSSGRFLL